MVYKNNFIAVVRYKGRIMRDVDGTVSLPFGSEYSIRLKNKDSRTAVVRIEVDGEDVMAGHRYIVPGNSTRELEGFLKGLKATHKFRFIKKTKEISKFRGDRIDDGIIRIEFWYEQTAQVTPWVTVYPSTGTYHYSNDFTLTDNSGTCGPIQQLYTQTAGDISSGLKSSTIACSHEVAAPKSDEGITVKGTKADQNFQYGNVGVLETQSSVIVIRLKGQVKRKGKVEKIRKPITVRTRIQCPTCGRRWKSHLKFCGNCSTALD